MAFHVSRKWDLQTKATPLCSSINWNGNIRPAWEWQSSSVIIDYQSQVKCPYWPILKKRHFFKIYPDTVRRWQICINQCVQHTDWRIRSRHCLNRHRLSVRASTVTKRCSVQRCASFWQNNHARETGLVSRKIYFKIKHCNNAQTNALCSRQDAVVERTYHKGLGKQRLCLKYVCIGYTEKRRCWRCAVWGQSDEWKRIE